MSFIRCLSNPEALYAWSDGVIVHLAHLVRKPHSSGNSMQIPDKTFTGAIKSYLKNVHPVKTEYHGMKIEKVVVDRITGKRIKDSRPCRTCKVLDKTSFIPCRACFRDSMQKAKRSWHAVEISYKGQFLRMWAVTWSYIIGHEVESFYRLRQPKK